MFKFKTQRLNVVTAVTLDCNMYILTLLLDLVPELHSSNCLYLLGLLGECWAGEAAAAVVHCTAQLTAFTDSRLCPVHFTPKQPQYFHNQLSLKRMYLKKAWRLRL